MHTQRIHEVLAEAIVGRHLLTHPFYRRWEAGTLSEGELAAYAEQYRHIERELPVTLSAIAAALPEGRARDLVEANLADELGTPEPHAELFESFADAAGARARGPRHPLHRGVAGRRAHDGGRTIQRLRWPWWRPTRSRRRTSPASKADGLRRHYGFDDDGTRFWDVHRTQEVDHAGWSMEALAELGADPDVVQAAAIVSADSWWLFFSEREEMAPAGARC